MAPSEAATVPPAPERVHFPAASTPRGQATSVDAPLPETGNSRTPETPAPVDWPDQPIDRAGPISAVATGIVIGLAALGLAFLVEAAIAVPVLWWFATSGGDGSLPLPGMAP